MRAKKSSFLNTLQDFVESYLPLEKGCSSKTVESYKTTYRLLLDYLYNQKNLSADQVTFDKLDYRTISGFLDWIQEERKCSARTRNQRLAALSSFSKYAMNINLEAAFLRNTLRNIPRKKTWSDIMPVFTLEEVRILMTMPNDHTEIGKRDKVLLSTMYGAGTRCDETCSLKVRNIHFDNGGGAHVDIINGKGGKSRSIWISEPCARIIKDYIHYRRLESHPEAFLFKSQTHEKMSVSALEEVYKKYITKAKKEHPDKFKAENYTPHTMRRTVASHMLESGIEMEVIRTFLGHSSIYTTSLYAVLSQQKMDRDLKNWATKWFPEENSDDEMNTTSNVPDFLR